jgi:hypothetical protein
MIRARVLSVVTICAASLAFADAPATSLRPVANPRAVSVPVTRLTVSSADHPAAATRPPARPEAGARPAASAESAAAMTTALGGLFPLEAVPRPHRRPKVEATDEAVQEAAVRTQPAPVIITGKKGSVCGDPGLRGVKIAPIAARLAGCGLADGVKVTSVEGIMLSTPATIDCTTALALRSWVSDGLKPIIGKRGGGVARIEVAGSYACRPRNNQPGQKISEHGRGKAIDITGIILKDGEIITVLHDWGKGEQGKILQGLHWVACHTFGTVLGPAANSFHRDHFHFDTARNNRKGSYCE